MATYYVKNGGSDAADGLSDGNAWETISKVNGESFSPGDSVLFNRGDTWREQLSAVASLTECTIGAYGSGDDPLILGSDQLTTWTQEIVGAGASKVQGEYHGTGTNGASATFGSTPTEGNLMIAIVRNFAVSSGLSISGWTQAEIVQTGSTAYLALMYKVAGSSESTTVTATWTGAGNTNIMIEEWSGVHAPDKTATNPNSGGVTSKSSGTTATTVQDNELCVAAFGMGDTISSPSLSNSFAIEQYPSIAGMILGTLAVSSADAYETTCSWTTTRVCGGLIVTFKATSGTTLYYASQATEPNAIWFYSGASITYGNKVASKAALASEYDWWFDDPNNRIYVVSATDPDSAYDSVEVSSRTAGIFIQSVATVTVENISVRHANSHGIYLYREADGATISGCNASYNYDIGIAGINNGTEAPDSVVVVGCTTAYNGRRGISAQDYSESWTVTENSVHHNGYEAESTLGTRAGIYFNGGNSLYGHTVDGNEVYANGSTESVSIAGAIWLDSVCSENGTAEPNCTVRGNHCHDNYIPGILVEKTNDSHVFANICVNNTNGTDDVAGIYVNTNFGHTASRNLVANNVCYGNYVGIKLDSDLSLADQISDNAVQNNIAVGNTSRQLKATAGAHNGGSYGSGNIYTYNCFGVEASGFVEWGSGVTKDTYDAWETAYGGTTNSVEADPLMVDPDNGDFHLQSGSPCRDAGVDVGLTTDFLGRAVPHGTGFDIGAFEYYSKGVASGLSRRLGLITRFIKGY